MSYYCCISGKEEQYHKIHNTIFAIYHIIFVYQITYNVYINKYIHDIVVQTYHKETISMTNKDLMLVESHNNAVCVLTMGVCTMHLVSSHCQQHTKGVSCACTL